MSKLSKNDQGIGTILLIVIIAVVVVVGGLAIWKLTTKKSPTTSNTSSSTQPASSTNTNVSAACLKAFNDKKLCTFAEHTNLNDQSYVANGTATSAGKTSTYTVNNDGKGNTEVTYTSGTQQVASISLDGATYVQQGGSGTWLSYSGSALATAAAAPNPASGFNLNFTNTTPAGVQVTNQGTASCGSSTCYKYKVIEASKPTTTTYVFFDTSSYLLKQWTYSDSSTNDSANLTFNYQPVTITKPSPVQQVSL